MPARPVKAHFALFRRERPSFVWQNPTLTSRTSASPPCRRHRVEALRDALSHTQTSVCRKSRLRGGACAAFPTPSFTPRSDPANDSATNRPSACSTRSTGRGCSMSLSRRPIRGLGPLRASQARGGESVLRPHLCRHHEVSRTERFVRFAF